MRTYFGLVLLAAISCGGDDSVAGAGKDAGNDSTPGAGKGAGGGIAGGTGAAGGAGKDAGKPGANTPLSLPQVYPLVRASTPTALIADSMFKAEPPPSPPPRDSGVGVLPQALGGAIGLAVAVQERFYMGGPTELLRIVKDLDDRVAGLDTDATKHTCLTAAPIENAYALPGGQTFRVKLQCLQAFGGPGSPGEGWVAFGFGHTDHSMLDDAGAEAADGGADSDQDDFYLVEGQAGGMGGAYRINGGDVEAWIAVADSNAPMNSQVIMHLITHKVPAVSELALAGAGVGFCSGHLKTSADFLYIQGKTNGAPPPGTGMLPGTQYCDASRAGCFAVTALDTDLGAEAEGCSSIANRSFEIHAALDASSDASANVVPASIYRYFNQRPVGVADF